ncbi:MAG: multiheme c-type cytochrome [Planctomycetota bacterium]
MRNPHYAIALFSVCISSLFSQASDLEFRGVASCRKCHLATSSGNQYEKWVESAHSSAYQTLTTAESFKIAKAKNIADPTKSADCLRCHVTAFDVPATKKGKAFDVTLGVQCESCHGAGSKHVEERLDGDSGDEDKALVLPKGEIITSPGADSCRACHNKDSPTYKPFAYNKFMPMIGHMDPRKKRPADYMQKLPADPKDDPAAVAPKKKE